MISVVIPAYNEESYIEHTLRSLHGQGVEYESIVVDGGSTDRTVQIARKYADRTLVVKKGGVSAARNAGASAAKGDIILFLDADTRMDKGSLTTIRNAFSDGVVGVCANVRSDGPLHAKVVYKITSAVACVTSLLRIPLFYGMCMAWRRDAFRRAGGFDEATRVGEDMKLTLALHNKGRCKWLRRATVVTSSRRLRGKFLFISPYMHFKNFFKLVLFGRTDKDYPVIR
ncbi:MAG: glycosyltransferase [Candidatus Aenigmatarchaeota archaeon]|nr:MAG: glycosyltransferase [Candidatus Aenigmarchaeota archaeon]